MFTQVTKNEWQAAAVNFAHEQFNPVAAEHFAVMQIVVGGETVNGQIKGGTVVGQAIYRNGAPAEYWLSPVVDAEAVWGSQLFFDCRKKALCAGQEQLNA